MAQNVEIKAHARDFQRQLAIAKTLAEHPSEILIQRDTFYKVPTGRLKLRRFADHTAELIYYQRPDTPEPSLSDYTITKVPDPASLHEVIKRACGVMSTVSKRRTLISCGRTRVHFDEVESLGNFIELEVVLRDDENLADGQHEAQSLMQQLGIEQTDLIDVAYVDMLEALA